MVVLAFLFYSTVALLSSNKPNGQPSVQFHQPRMLVAMVVKGVKLIIERITFTNNVE